MEPANRPEPVDVSRDERELAALRAGDEAAFLSLVSRYHGAMIRVAQAYVRTRAVAEEVVQEAWLGVLHGLDGFEGRSSLRSWIFRIVANCAKARGARESRAVPFSSLEDASEEEPAVSADRFQAEGERWAGNWSRPPEPWPEDRVHSNEMLELVAQGLETLPESQRTVMTLRDVDGLEAAEVCELLGLSEGNQRVLLHRARSKVRAFVERRLGGEEPP